MTSPRDLRTVADLDRVNPHQDASRVPAAPRLSPRAQHRPPPCSLLPPPNLPNPAIQTRHITRMPCCSALLLLLLRLRASLLHRPVASEHPVPSLSFKREIESARRDSPFSPFLLSLLPPPPSPGILVFATLARQPTMGTTQFIESGIHNRTRRGERSLIDIYAIYGDNVFYRTRDER